jgi:hypothetical protein
MVAAQEPQPPAAPAAPVSITATPKAPEPVLDEHGQVVLEKPAPEAPAGDALYAPLAVGGPQTLQERFTEYAVRTFGPRAVVTPAFGAAIRQANPNPNYPENWQTGFGAFGRNYGSGLARKTTFETARFTAGALLHEDTRYRPSTVKNPVGRALYAVSFVFVDRSDAGRPRLALANFAAAASAGYVQNLYLPDGFNDARHADRRMLQQFGGLAIGNVTREFAPEIYRVTRKLHVPFPRIPVPEWWVGRSGAARQP